jgi:hypothetical protein
METGANANTWGNNTNTNLETLDAFAAGYLSKSVAGSANVTLTSNNADPTAESSNKVIEFTGALTGDITVFVPAVENNYIFFNNTSGAQTLTVAPTGHGSNGVAITQGAHTIMYCTGDSMTDLFANSLGNISIKGTANVTGAATFNDDVTVADGKTINTQNITLNSNGLVTATSYTGNGAGLTGVDPFEANTSMIFNQASAPTGWTKQTGTALANTAMSIVTGTGGGTGGSDSFYSTFASSRNTDTSAATVSVSGSVGGTTLSTPTIASHNHPRPALPTGNFGNARSPNNSQPTSFHPLGIQLQQAGNERVQQNPQSPFSLGNAGGGGSHSHPFSVSSSSLGGTISMPAMDVKYANVIVANKD